ANVTTVDITPDVILSSSYLLDINSDGTNDFKFTANKICACVGAVCQATVAIQPISAESCVMAGSSNEGVYYSVDDTSHYTSNTGVYTKLFSYGDIISLNENCSGENTRIFICSYGSCPPSSASGYSTYGAILGAGVKYIPIRYGNFLGWIKIGFDPATYNLKIYESAISKDNISN
ncbi:MAG: hypothetical protein H0W73_20045, partial [Bacteroidetes bacterium]|nr:hypothetical protein [Bacteroidota bacterium]